MSTTPETTSETFEREAALSKRLAEVAFEIESIEAAIEPLKKRLVTSRREFDCLKSKHFILINRVRKEDIEMSSGEGKPRFYTVTGFIKWMRAQSIQKPWAEWNGRIYRTYDLMSENMPDMPGFICDLD